MCGLFGWDLIGRAEPLRQDQKASLALAMFLYNDLRGGDSWGIYRPSMPKEDPHRIIKGFGNGAPSFRSIGGSDWVLVHTRKKTHGDIALPNQHPFEDGPIVGMHNGVISSHTLANQEFKREFDVDSQHLIRHLAEDRPLSDWEALNGYGVLIWTDERRPGQTLFVRFNTGSLCICRLEGGGLVWSSDESHLKKSLSVSELEIESRYAFPEDQVHGTLVGQDHLIVYKKWIRRAKPRYFGNTPYTGPYVHAGPYVHPGAGVKKSQSEMVQAASAAAAVASAAPAKEQPLQLPLRATTTQDGQAAAQKAKESTVPEIILDLSGTVVAQDQIEDEVVMPMFKTEGAEDTAVGANPRMRKTAKYPAVREV